MILEYLAKRTGRERTAWGLTAILLVVVLCYLTGVAPALESYEGAQEDLSTTESSLALQRRQLTALRAETVRCHRILDRLKDVPCPWVPAAKADALLRQWQKEAEDLGLSVHSVIRERQVDMRLQEAAAPVSMLIVQLELHGPYDAVMKLVEKLGEGPVAVGLEEVLIKGFDAEPYDVEVALLVRLPVFEGETDA